MRRLDMTAFPVHDIRFGAHEGWAAGVVIVDPARLEDMLTAVPGVESVRLSVARPGDAIRIINVLDAVEPRAHVNDGAVDFPGVLGEPVTAGSGQVHRLAGAAVIATGRIPDTDNFMRQYDAIIDMSGPGAAYSPFAATVNLVVAYGFAATVGGVARARAVRTGNALVARHLALCTRDGDPGGPGHHPAPIQRETFMLAPVDPALPGVALVCAVPCFGTLLQSVLYGRPVTEFFPTLLHPNELLDGALQCCEYHFGGHRSPTYFFQNHPALLELYRGHGRTWAFRGVVILGQFPSDEDKRRSAHMAASLVQGLGASGAIITGAFGGNSMIDALYTSRNCEALGIKTVLVVAELAGTGSSGLPLALPENRVIISAGCKEAPVDLPAMPSVVGGDQLIRYPDAPGGALRVPVNVMLSSVNQQGGWHLRAVEF